MVAYRRLRKWPGPEPPDTKAKHTSESPPGGDSGPPSTSQPKPAPEGDPGPPTTFFSLIKYAIQNTRRAVRFCCVAIVLFGCLFGGITVVVYAIKGIHWHIPAIDMHELSYIVTASLFLGGSGLTLL